MRHRGLGIGLILSLACVAYAGPASSDDKDERKEWREWEKDRREDERERDKSAREAQREWLKNQRERQKALREARHELVREGWYDGRRWYDYDRDYRYRDRYWGAIERHPAPFEYRYPGRHEVIVYAPGMRLPQTYVVYDYVIADPLRYGLPPPPPDHRWLQVDDDAVLIALASGVVADFVYDLFETS